MHPDKVDRKQLCVLTDLPNVGKATAADLQLLGITRPQDLAGRDAYVLYYELCAQTGQRHDPCVIDVFFPSLILSTVTRRRRGGSIQRNVGKR